MPIRRLQALTAQSATSGRHATVVPFSSDLPMMDMVEIGDVALAY
jgi:hypothetical protein